MKMARAPKRAHFEPKALSGEATPPPSSAPAAAAANTPPVSSTVDPSHGPTVVPSELKNWEKFRRACELLREPSAATSGLAATCSRVTPEPITNRALRTPGYQSTMVATGTIRQPSTITARAEMIERL